MRSLWLPHITPDIRCRVNRLFGSLWDCSDGKYSCSKVWSISNGAGIPLRLHYASRNNTMSFVFFFVGCDSFPGALRAVFCVYFNVFLSFNRITKSDLGVCQLGSDLPISQSDIRAHL
jgi:hypothetical protein